MLDWLYRRHVRDWLFERTKDDAEKAHELVLRGMKALEPWLWLY